MRRTADNMKTNNSDKPPASENAVPSASPVTKGRCARPHRAPPTPDQGS